MLEEFLNSKICGNEETKKYIYENVPNIGDKIEKIISIKEEYDRAMSFFEMEVYNVLVEMRRENE